MRLLRPIARHRRGLLGALTLAVAAGVVVVLVLVAGSPSPTPASGAAKTAAGAATVKRRNLVQTDTEAGTLSYANPQTVYDRLSGTITWLPSVGQVIRAGGTLFRVNGTPVILMDGSAAAYRTLSSADGDGEDILQLNRNLVALGFNANGIVVDDQWQEATTLGVELLQESLGETATGSLSLGRVVFLPGPQLVSTVEGTVGDTDNGGSSATPASLTTDPPSSEFVSLTTSDTTTTTTTTTSTTPATTTPTTTTTTPTTHHKPKKGAGRTPSLQALLALLRAESAQLKAEAEQLKAEQHQNGGSPSGSGSGSGSGNKSNSGNTSNSGNKSNSNSGNGGNTGNSGNSPSSGSAGSTGVAVLQTNSNHLVVTVDLDASLQSEAKVGEKVSVQLPAGNTVSGKVTAVSSVAQSSSSGNNGSGSGSGSGGGNGGGGGGGGGSGGGNGGSGSSTIPVTVTLSGHHKGAGLDEAAVSVNFAQARAKNVLSVPVTALLAVSGGNYAVQEASAPHTLIPVTVGLFAAGYVQISGPGIHTGLQVTDSQG
jgi:hypothetical protein